MSAKKDRAKMCESVLRLILDIANKQGSITFEQDFGGNTLTVIVEDKGHTHVGYPSCSFEDLVEGLQNSLSGRGGLSWVE